MFQRHIPKILKAPVFHRSLSGLVRPDAVATRMLGLGDSIWTEFTPLALKCGAVNLGQGFPNFAPPDFVVKNLEKVIQEPHLSQYTRSQGYLGLVEALSTYYKGWIGRELDPLTEIEVTVGATQAIYLSLMATVNPGDEVITIEPFYDSYGPVIEMAGGIPVSVPLRTIGSGLKASDWVLDTDELKRAITPRTKMIIVNTPQNCPGKVYSREELQALADVALANNLLVLSDDSYDALTYDGVELVKMASLPGMWDRTITIGSAGKTFSVTGWKIGWIIAPTSLMRPLGLAQQQAAVARCFTDAFQNDYFSSLKQEYTRRRNLLLNVLAKSGLTGVKPQGAFFVLADISAVDPAAYFDQSDRTPRDHQFCRWLTKHIGVAAIPPSAFYQPKDQKLIQNFARFAFCKSDETIQAAEVKLRQLGEYIR